MEYVIYCDESDSKGKFYSDFYGGLLIRSTDLERVTQALQQKKQALNLNNELKWQRITANYLEKYREMVELFFTFIKDGTIKVRIMFRQNLNVPPRYDADKRDNKYFLLYYQFIKHAFGLRYAHESPNTRVRLYLDVMPDTKEKVEAFKWRILALNKHNFFRSNSVYFDKEQIAEIDSQDHVLAQCLDIVLGSMQFRLNDKHKEKPEGSRVRGKRTIAKEHLYKYINSQIREIYQNFNVGVSTSNRGDNNNYWLDPYRHWNFKAHGSEMNRDLGKNN